MGSNYEELFIHTLKHQQIQTVFQPIISLQTGEVYGYEALSRGLEHTAMCNPKRLFSYATKLNRLWELESLCRQKALEAANELKLQAKLFLNVNPNIMSDPKFQEGFTKAFLKKYELIAEKIVFELTEQESISHRDNFQLAVKHYKDQQYELAIDDVGSGYSGLTVIANVRPHYLKIDMELIRDIDTNATKQMLVKSLLQFAEHEHSKVIAEGIETLEEFQTLVEMGVHFGQGYFIQKPSKHVKPIRKEVMQAIGKFQFQKETVCQLQLDMTIGSIAKPLQMIKHTTLIQDVALMLEQDDDLPGICIEKKGQLLGVVTRNALTVKISGMYGYSLHANREVYKIMSTSFLVVESTTSIRKVAQLAMARPNEKTYDFITVIKGGQYFGIVTVKELLQKSMELEVNYAKHLNPLSGLPGNIMIEQEIKKCINSSSAYALLYFDLDNFKPFNDVYGFEKGDQILIELARLIEKVVGGNGFVGHIGGDDFIVVTTTESYQQICERTIELFDQQIYKYYAAKHLMDGFITTKNRHGEEERFPLLTLSIAVILTEHFYSISALVERASIIKKKCKQIEGSCYIVDQQTVPINFFGAT